MRRGAAARAASRDRVDKLWQVTTYRHGRARAAVVLPASAPQRAHRPLESIVSNVFPASFRNRLARGRTGSPGRAHGDRRVQHAGTPATVQAYAGPMLLIWTCLLLVSNLYAAGRHARRLVASPAVRQGTW